MNQKKSQHRKNHQKRSNTEKLQFILVLPLILFTLIANCQVSGIGYRVNFYYDSTKQVKEINISSDRDTFNRIIYGNREGFWFEPQFLMRLENVDTVQIRKFIFDTIDKSYVFKIKRNRHNIGIYNIIQKPNLDYKITWYSDNNLNNYSPTFDHTLNGLYFEKYWLGYIHGEYKNGVRIGSWKYIPMIEEDSLNFIINCFQEDLSSTKYQEIYNNNCLYLAPDVYLSGNYLNNTRNGIWKICSNLELKLFSEDRAFFSKGKLDSICTIENDSLVTIARIVISGSNKFLYSVKHDLYFDITGISSEIITLGEREYFWLFPIKRP